MPKVTKELKFIDMFCGIGGFHEAFHTLGHNCVMACDIDRKARITYEANYRKYSPEMFKEGLFLEDAKKIKGAELPDFDVLCAGFPCQPFSNAGFKKGFEDKERGTLFHDIVRIAEAKRPAALFLENVRGIVNHDDGRTLEIIEKELRKRDYTFEMKVVKASDYGLPQLRPRAYMICFHEPRLKKRGGAPEFCFPPKKKELKFNMSDVFGGNCPREVGYTLRCGGRKSGVDDRRNWDGYMIDGKQRFLGPEEGKRMMGFPKSFKFPAGVSETDAMKQLGNSVAVDAIYEVADAMVSYMSENMYL